jgi:uncharacterized membrane protein
VREQRLPWLLTSALMLASAASAAWSTYLYWLPCRGTMLEGTIVHPGGGDGRSYEEYEKLDPAVKASMDACLRRMDGDISELAPWTSELGVAATALAGVAWLTLVLGLRWQLRTKAVAALPGLATLVVALAEAAALGDAAGHDREESLPMMLLFSIELAAVVALVAILAWQSEVVGNCLLRLVVVLWGTTAFGAIHTIAEFVAMIIFSDRDWDTPPGTGYITVAVITISAILTVILTLRAPQRRVDDEPHQDHHSGSITLA